MLLAPLLALLGASQALQHICCLFMLQRIVYHHSYGVLDQLGCTILPTTVYGAMSSVIADRLAWASVL